MILRILNILTDALSPSCISGRVVNAAGTAAARSRYYRPAAGKMSCFQAVLRSSDHSRCQEPVGLRKILLRRWENGPNHPDFPLRRISHAPRNHDALFSLSPPPRYETPVSKRFLGLFQSDMADIMVTEKHGKKHRH